MTFARVYLDWNATAPLRPEARAAMLAALDTVGNPSSVHAEGRTARAIIEQARDDVAALVGGEPHNVIVASGATEAAAMSLTPDWRGGPFSSLYVSAIEHPCVLAGGRFQAPDITRVPVTEAGILDITALKQMLSARSGRPLVALMAANNETGIVQPVAEAAAAAHSAGGLLVCDAVQAAGRIQTHITELGADALLLSAHKLGGPKGVGALVLANEAIAPQPLLTGGGQERRQRAGTENVAGIAGFGAAAKAAKTGLVAASQIAAPRDRLETGLRDDGARCQSARKRNQKVFASTSQHSILNKDVSAPQRLPNTSLLVMPDMSAQMLLMQLDLAGFAVSAGAACSSGKLARSHVLEAMGVPPEIAEGAIRVSLGPTTTAADIDRFIAAWSAISSAHAARQSATRAQPASIGAAHARSP